MIWLRALAFILIVQAGVVAIVPAAIVTNGSGPVLPIGGVRYMGVVPLALGAAILLWCNYAFIVRGLGTAAPYDPPRELVATGVYRYVRNPMYISALLMTLGESLLWRSAALLGYTILLAIAYSLFVRFYEEPRLSRIFGVAYREYCAAVPRWLPRANGSRRRKVDEKGQQCD